VQPGLTGEQAGDDSLRARALDLQAAELGSPPAVEDALDPDLVRGRPAGGAHARSRQGPG